MAYSSIKRKTCKCGCSKMPTISCKGYNYSCLPDAEKEKLGSKRKLQQQKANAARYASTKLRMGNYKKNCELEMWFKERALEIEKHPYCWEDGTYIPVKYFRHATAHIFPKKLFPSIATHPLNFLVLAASCCHDKSHTIETFSKMKCFPLAIERFYQFEKQITEKHKYLDLFKEAIKNYKQ